MAKSVAQIIEGKGGATAFAAALGKTALVVRMWKHRNRIPRSAWPEIVKAYPDLTLDKLLATEPKPRKGRAA